jgi:hypothetical protein
MAIFAHGRRTRRLTFALKPCCLAAVVCLSACDEAGSEGGESGDTQIAGPCDDEPRAMEYAAGLQVTSDAELFRAALIDASPAPPARFVNDWQLEFELVGEASLDDLQVEVTPWMPDHGHGSANPISIKAGDIAGSYSVTNIDLFMAGYWEVHLDLEAADGSWSDRATFAFCVE